MNSWTIVAGGLGMVAVVSAGALLLPRHVHVERQAALDTTIDAVIALAASNEGYQHFNPYLSADPDLKITRFGPDSGGRTGLG